MKRILISQRRDRIPNRDEERDATDTRIGKMFFDLGYLPLFLCSDIEDRTSYIEALEPDGIFIGSGNDIGEFPTRDLLEEALLAYAESQQLPVFAICRGTQMLNHYLGGHLTAVSGHVAVRDTLLGPWAEERGYDTVNSYHNFAVTQQTLASALKALAWTEDGVIKALAHKELPWLGIMWHPEREAKVPEQDAQLIASVLG